MSHKIRNTKHLELLNEIYNMKIIPRGYSDPLSKRMIKKFLIYNKWYKQKTLDFIESYEWWYWDVDD